MERIKIDIRNESNQIQKIFYGKDLVSVEDLLDMICELDDKVSGLEQQKKDMEQDIEDNYRKIPVSEQYE